MANSCLVSCPRTGLEPGTLAPGTTAPPTLLGKESDKIMADFLLQIVLTEREVHVSMRVFIER